jgi:hypothetical protein
MTSVTRKAKQRTTVGRSYRVGISSSGRLDDYLVHILASLAQLLLRNGYGYKRVSKLSRIAFVQAASTLDSAPGKKMSIAQIAAVTGLTRLEVSRLRRNENQTSRDHSEPPNRAISVVTGWISDSSFLDENNSPRSLRFAGTRSFAELVRRYSGDIPARAMLREMKRMRIVRQDARDVVSLVKRKISASKSSIAAMRAISPWVAFISNAERGDRGDQLTASASQTRVHFDSLPEVFAAVRDIELRRAAFVDGLANMGTRSTNNGNYELDISVAVAAAKPTRAKSKGIEKARRNEKKTT